MPTTPILRLPYPSPNEAPDGPVQIKALAEKIEGVGGGGGVLIVGEIRLMAVVATPAGWLLADGAAVSRATYAALFAAIGTAFGAGDGSTTFALPDARGRALIGAGQGPGLTNRVVGTKWGVEAVVLSTAQMPAHAHGVSDPGHAHSNTHGSYLEVSSVVSTYLNTTNNAQYAVYHAPGTAAALTGVSVQNNGGGGGHDNTQPSLAIPAYIYAGA